MDFTKEFKEINEVTTEVKVTVSAESIESAYQTALKEVSQKAHLKGFRQGKAPKKMIEKLYGGRARLEVIDDQVKEVVTKLVEDLERKDQLATRPEVDFISMEPEKPLELKVVFYFIPQPEIKVDKIEIEVTKQKKVTEKDIDRALERVVKSIQKEQGEDQAPEINDELAKKAGYEGVETVADLRKKLTELIEKENKRFWEQEKEHKIIDFLSQSNQFEIPEGMVTENALHIFKQYSGGKECKPEELPDTLKESSASQIRHSIILSQIAKSNNLEVTTEDLKAHIAEMADDMGIEASVLESFYSQQQYAENMRAEMMSKKVFEFLADKVSVKEVKPKKKSVKKEKKADEK